MQHRVPITVRLESFEGPLDLLLYLIQSHELDISTVSISKITDQYLAYIRLIQEWDFDAASEFLVMAATLLHWKSKSLLPDENAGDKALGEEPALTQEDLVRQLLEHQRFRATGQRLAELPTLGFDTFKRPAEKPPIERVWKEMNVTALARQYQEIIARARYRVTVLKKETVSLADKIREFRALPIGKLIELKQLFGPIASRPEVVVTFLASLELSRLRKMKLFQEQIYGPILVELLESLNEFDERLASGFDNPVAALEAQSLTPDLPAPAPDLPAPDLNVLLPDEISERTPLDPTLSAMELAQPPSQAAPAPPVHDAGAGPGQ